MKTYKVTGFFSKEMAQKQANLDVSQGKQAYVVPGDPIDSYLGELERWDVVITVKQ